MDNAFAAPEVDEAARWPDEEDGHLGRLPFERLKKLYLRSCNVSGVAVLMILGAIYLIALPSLIPAEMPRNETALVFQTVLTTLGILYLIGAVGIFLRARWGRIVGIIACVLMLANIPLGTIIGIIGLFAFIGAPKLFGPDRLRHGDLKQAYKAAKRERKMARRGLA